MASITINTITTDDTINAQEHADGIALSGTVSGVADGNTVTIDLLDANDVLIATLGTGIVSGSSWSTTSLLNVAILADLTNYTIQVTAKLGAGNSGVAKVTTGNFITVDESADRDAPLDLTVAAAHLKSSDFAVTLTGIDSDFASGTVTLTDGVHTTTHTLTAPEAATGSVTLHAADFADYATLVDGNITVSALIHDAAGNPAHPANESFLLDNSADADGTPLSLNAANPAGGANAGAVSVTLSGIDSDFASGTVTLTDGNSHIATHTLTPGEISGGAVTLLSSDFAGFASLDHADSAITVSASVTDTVGNSAAPGNASFTLDTTADAGTALSLSAFDALTGVSAANVAVTLSGVDGDFASGTVTLGDGLHTATHTLTAGELSGGSVTLQATDFSGFNTLTRTPPSRSRPR